MKRNVKCLAAVMAAALLAGCGGAASGSQSAAPTPTATATAQVETAGCKTGFAVEASFSDDETSGQASVMAAGVLLDSEGRILRCVIDSVENKMTANPDGTVAMPAPAATKWEQGDDYGMKKASGIGKEWYEQCQAFCDHIQGMTAQQVGEIDTEGGKPTDPDLLSGCTIKVTPFIAVVAKACEQARSMGAGETDAISLGTASTASSKDATDDADGKAQVASTFVLMTKNTDGRVTSAVMDVAEAAFRVDTTGALISPDSFATKLEQGDNYGMKKASGIGKEWYEQSEAFCAYLKGKTAGEIRAIPATGEDADLAAVCTISWGDMLQAAVKAADAA